MWVCREMNEIWIDIVININKMYLNKFAPIILACVQINMIHIYNGDPIG